MNNSKIAIDRVSLKLDEKVDNTEHLRERESVLVRIIEAIKRVKESEDWNTLKTLLFDGSLDKLEKRLQIESEKPKLDDSEMYRLQGQISWARKYVDLDKLADAYRVELSNLRKNYE